MSHVSGRRTGTLLADDGHERRSKKGFGVIALWIGGGMAAVGGIIALVVAVRRGPHSDLGTVSSQWISEHRLGSNQDYSRR